MSTRSLTRVLDVEENILVTLYRHCDGYIDGGMGDDLIEFLKGKRVVNGLSVSLGDNDDAVNGMECVAAQLVSYFKVGPGGIYLYPPTAEPEEFNYVISLKNGSLTLTVTEGPDWVGRQLYPVPSDEPVETERVVEFLYPITGARSYATQTNLWRKIKVIEQTDEYIIGNDLGDEDKFKRFRIDRIVGGVSKVFESKA